MDDTAIDTTDTTADATDVAAGDIATDGGISREDLEALLANPYVERFENGRITYSRDFHAALYAKIRDEHMTYVGAYSALGLDVGVLGENRALAAGRRTMEMARNNQLDRQRIRYDGSVPPDQMGDLAPEEELAYLRARNLYLEAVVQAQKKLRSALAARG